ncbi:MAG: hypothetical protein F4Y99_00085, partial [Acidimicrobiaceae bacterium]|nr:hypothetical protein [Acidimicrobiaceae bacterium]
MVEVPEYLLQRSRERRAELTGTEPADAGDAAPAGEAPASAAPAATAAVPAPAAPAPIPEA